MCIATLDNSSNQETRPLTGDFFNSIDPFQTFGIAARSSQKRSLTEFKFKTRNFGFSFGR